MCRHRRSKEQLTKAQQRSRSSMDHVPKRSPILDTTPTLERILISGRVKESAQVHVMSSHSADVRDGSKTDLLMQMLTRDPSVSSYNRGQPRHESVGSRGRHQIKVCEDYFKMIPKIQESQERIIFGLKDEIQELDNEIKTLQANLAQAIRPDQE